MKRVLSLGLVFLSFFLLRCEDDALENPHYPVEPSISFKGIKFIETPAVNEYDTLKLTIKYKDGDSDLGLSLQSGISQHYFFLEDGSGDTLKIKAAAFDEHTVIDIPSYSDSLWAWKKLVTSKTRQKAAYNYLPEYNSDLCQFYTPITVTVRGSLRLVDETYNIIDTIISESSEPYFVVDDVFFTTNNPNYSNFTIQFFISDDGVNFTEFDWFSEFCLDYNTKFPNIPNHGTINSGPFTISAKSPWEGNITYNMANTSYVTLFSNKTLKLRITIKDRALHSSNVIETPPFTLESIK